MSYTQFVDGYALETSFADGTTIDGAGDTAYRLGAVSGQSVMPSPVFPINYTPVGVNAHEVGAGLVWKGQPELRGMLGLVMQNGVPIYLGIGNSATAGSGPYTHTITPSTDGTQMPSFVLQHEEKGTATNEEYQFQGCKVDSLLLHHDLSGANVLMARMEVMASKAIDPGFALTTTPALPATANSSPYVNLTRTWDYGSGNTAIDGLKKVELTIVNGLRPLFAHSYDTGVYTGQWAYAFVEAARKQYTIDLTLSKNTIERAVWDELITLSNTKELYLKWTRSTNDYIAVTATDCQVAEHSLVTQEPGISDEVVVRLQPRALSFEVKDSIAGGAYGD